MPARTVRDEAGAGSPGTPVSEPAGPTAQPIRDLAEAGWIRIPNKGRLPSKMGGDSVAFGEAGHHGSDRALGRQSQADGSIRFESGSPALQPENADDRAMMAATVPTTGLGPAVRGVRPVGDSKTDPGSSSRVKPSRHIVEPGENFWTIARLYYGSGRRYYRALWKYNAQKYPNIAEIHVDDVIEIPAVEDLNPAYIERPSSRQVASLHNDANRDLAGEPAEPAPASSERPKSFPTTQTTRTSDTTDGIPARRPARIDRALELPVGDADLEMARGGRGTSADGSGGDGPLTRSTAKPRNPVPSDRPVYKVRRYDSLRSIARDILGDSRRADEIYEINRDVIKDPTHLTPGQLLELPDDADTRSITINDRYRGSD
jgi:nucleoid-associated protein YgaU